MISVKLRFKFEANSKSIHFEIPKQELVPHGIKNEELNDDDEDGDDDSEIERLRIEIMKLRKEIAKLNAQSAALELFPQKNYYSFFVISLRIFATEFLKLKLNTLNKNITTIFFSH